MDSSNEETRSLTPAWSGYAKRPRSRLRRLMIFLRASLTISSASRFPMTTLRSWRFDGLTDPARERPPDLRRLSPSIGAMAYDADIAHRIRQLLADEAHVTEKK